MNTIETIILTSIVNIIITGLVGGIVIYTVQKKIDATIQKSLFEYQTKFSVNYAKSVETLQTLYQKFIRLHNAVEEMISARRGYPETTEENEWEQKHNNVKDILQDFGHYYKDNRLFLPARLADNISDIFSQAEWISLALFLALLAAKPDETHTLNWPSDTRRPFTMTFNKAEVQYDNPELLLHDMRKELNRQATHLERLYKSVAEAEH